MFRIGVVFAIGLAVGCHGPGGEEAGDGAPLDAAPPTGDGPPPPDGPPPFDFAKCDENRMPLPPLIEDRTVYDQDPPGLWTVHVTVPDLAGLEAVNAGVEGAEVPAFFVDGDFGAGLTEPNATMRIRGGMSRRNVQKNYKIELHDGSRWHGQKEINLNKHMWDLTRMRNKLAFDVFQTIPHFTSLRTHYVRMFVNGDDYGLYTWIEEPDKRFLSSHGLDPDGQLYKAVEFYFQRIDPALAGDEEAMRTYVETKANPDHDKFLRMVDAVNDPARSHDEVIDTYFNRDNLITWLAVNVLLNDIDSRSQNFFLYSPSSCEGWYILPWDYDGAWGLYGQHGEDLRERWERGLTNWWMMDLFDRFYRDPANVAAIHQRILELSQDELTDQVTAELIARNHDIVAEHIFRDPDLERLPASGDEMAVWEAELLRITSTTSRFLAEYQSVIERPMPIHIAAYDNPAGHRFRWNPSYDLQQDPIRYEVQVAWTPAFSPADLVVQHAGIDDDELLVAPLPSGTYYWRVLIHDGKGPDTWQGSYYAEELVVP